MQKFLRTLTLVALLVVPWVTQGQNARVSEYDYNVTTATYSTIVGTSGATAWTAANQTDGYVDIAMPFAMYFGETQIASGSTLRVYDNGSAEFMSLTGSQLAPLYYASGYGTTATSVYTKSTAQQLTVEWRKVTANGNSSYSFQLKLYPGGDVEFCYGPMTLGSTISVFSGLKSSDADVFRARGEGGTLYWNTLERATDYATRTLSSNYYPAQGTVYTFTQPACVKPNTLVATSTDGGATLAWSSRSTSFQVKYSTNANFDPATEGTQVTANDTTKTLTGLTNFTTYYWCVRAVCGGTPSAWSEKSSFVSGTIVNMGDQATLTTCSAMIYDNGGADASYGSSADETLVITPATAGKRIRLVGTYNTEGCCDGLTVYDGDSTTGAILGSFYGDGTIDIAGENGAVTLVFTSDGSVVNDGFAVMATCENIPTCPNPAAPSVTAEGVVTWAASNNATSYDILWGATGFNPASAGTAVNGLTGTTTTLEGLASTTTYDVYLRAHCSATNEVTEWVGPVSFTTPCIGSCTHTITMSDDYGDGWEGHTIDLYVNGTFQESITLSSGSSGEATVYLCPGTQFVYIWHQNGGTMYSENNFTITDHNNDVIYTCVAEAGLSDGIQLVSGQSCFTPNCPHPSITSATAEGVITWDASTNATSYEIKYGVAGFDVETEGTLVQNLTGTTHTLTGLASSTNYDVYLRAICSATSETSDWSAAASFTTACMPMALPYAEDFESYTYSTSTYSGATALPTCWVIHSDFTKTRLPHIYRTSNNNSLEMTAGTSNCIQNNIAVLPDFTQPLSNLQISFDCSRESGQADTKIFIGYVTDASDSTTFVSLTELTDVSSSFSHYEYSFAGNTIPAGARMALKVWRSSSYYWARFDNVLVEAIPTCVKPTAVEATTVTTNSATLTWTENNTATAWNVLYGPAGFDPETEGTTVNANGTATVTLTDLTSNTVYDVYVQSVCVAGVDISAWSNVYTFRTECGILSLPYSEDFAAYTGLPTYPYYGPAVTPACWNYYSNGTNTAETSGSSSYYGGVGYYSYTSSYGALVAYDNYLCLPSFNCSDAASATYQNYLAQRGNVRYAVFPQFTTAINNMLLSFDYKMSVSTATNTLYLGYITTDTSSFTVLATYPATTTIQNVVDLDLSALASNAPAGARLAFKWENLTKTSNYGTTAYCGIDNIAIRQIPNCNSPINVAASDVTNSTAVITWTERTNPAATNWTLKYGTAGFDPENAGTTVAVSTTPSYELTGLDAYTYYDVYVRAECSAIENSEWSGVYTFRTVCPDGGDMIIGDVTATTTSNYLPEYHFYNYSLSEQIFTAEELGGANTFSTISFYVTTAKATTRNVDVYLVETDKAAFASTTDWTSTTGATLVYSGNFTPSETGWMTLPLIAPFNYSGANNLMVIFHDKTGSYVSSPYAGYRTSAAPASNMALYKYQDSPVIDPTNFTTAGTLLSVRNVITFGANCNTNVTCFAPASVSTAITPANVVTVTWAPRTDLRPVVNNYELKYGLEGFDPETQGVLVPALNNVNTYTINADLAASTNYDVYVRTACDANSDDYSAWTKGSFTTYPTCWVPVDLTVTGTTQTTATLSWANDSLAPTVATRWEVCYGPEGFGDPEYRGTKVETTNNTAFTVEGLNHSRKYEFYVRAICSATDKSEWSAVAIGTMQCGVWQYADMPLVENFDSYTGNTSGTVANHRMPNCWSYLNAGTNTTYMGLPSIYNGTTAYYKHSTPNSLRFYSPTATTNGDQIAILPEFGFDLDTLEISFYAAFNNVNAGLQVGVISDPTDASTFEAIETVHATSTNTQLPFEVSFSEYTGSARYVAFKVEHSTSTAQYIYMDDLTVKLREKVNVLPNNGGTIVACNEFVMPDTATLHGTYNGNLNATYVIRPAQAGYVARIQGDYDLENGYDFLNVYRGAANANNLVGRYTGTGSIDYMTSSNLWADSGYVTLVFTSDLDNAFANTGFKFLVTCEQPMASEDTIQDVIVTNGTYTWTEGNGQTYTNHSTLEAAPDLTEDIVFPVVNVAGFDSVYRHLDLIVHPTYELNYAATICERDTFDFYGQSYTTAGTYTVTLQSQYNADSTGILALTVNSAPSAFIQYNNKTVTAVADMCDNFDMTLNARSNVEGATFLWEDSSTAALRVVNPHESNTYSVVAINPATGCTSLPATVTVTTTPVPALTITGDSAICYGQSATLTLADANNVPATYRWSTNATTESITVNPTTTTTYTVTATSTTGACVATAEFTVTVNALPVVEVAAAPTVICQNDMINLSASNVDGYSYMWNTGAATAEATVAAATTGNYTVTVTDQNGCVNEFTTNNVTVNPVYELNDEQSACVGMLPVAWGTESLLEAGSYNQTFQTINGCDSTVHLTFIVQDTANNNSYRELCEGATFTFGTGIYEQTYTATTSTVISYVDTTSGECPARYNLYLTVNTHNPATVENTVCDTYTWPLTNETYTVSGAYQTTLQTTKGCDSVVTLNLTVNYQNTGVDEQTACDSYEWIDGNTYTASNNAATFTLPNQYGCDSVVTLNLTVNYRSYHEDFHRVCDAKTFTWDDNEVYELDVPLADSIQHITGVNGDGCLEIALLHLDMNYVNDTVRQTVAACDEYVIDTVACDNSVATAYLRDNGVYTLRVHNDSLNRDEMLILTLTVTPSTYHTTIATECLPYTWTIMDANNDPFEIATITADMVNGAAVYHTSVDLNEAGFANASSGCANIEVLRLTPKYPTEEVTEATICQNGTWYSADSTVTYNGADLNVGLNTMTWNTSTNAAGCQHLDKVALTVNPTEDTTVDMTYCENEFVNGIFNYIEGNDTLPLTIDVAGLNENVYTNTLTADWATAEGCARTVTVNYTVNPTTTEVETVQALTEYIWAENGVRYEGLGHHFDAVETTNVYGCTLYKVLDLEITDSIRHYDTINVCTSYEVEGETYYEDKTFSKADANDEVWYTTYHVMQRTFNDVNIVTNAPYTWINGETYTANVSNVYYSIPAADPSQCDDVYRLNLTMHDPMVLCEGQLPFLTDYGFTIDSAASDVYTSANNDTIIAYTVKLNTLTNLNETACDTYTWNDSILGNTTYTESGVYTKTYVAANDCDSIVTLNLTINASTVSSENVTYCDSYTWHGTTYTQSGSYTFDTVNANGCDSTAGLVLTINVNNGVVDSIVACDSYTWNGQTFTTSGDHSVTFDDANGCTGDSVLNLTIKNSVVANADSIVNAAATYYLGVLYEAPYDGYINDTLAQGAANGCDSITVMHLQVNNGVFISFDTVVCGDYTWIDGNTYTWIPMEERYQHNPAINYKNRTTGEYVEEYPIFVVDANNDGIIDTTYVLYLNLAEAHVEYKTVDVLLSRVNDANYDVDGNMFDFTAEKAAKQNATREETVSYGSSYYCDSIVYYTFNLVYNYVDDDTVTVCNEVATYTNANNNVIALAEGINVFTDTTAAGTDTEVVHNKVYVRSAAITGTETIAACDSTTWNNTLFTANVVDSLVTLTAANGCDSVVTLNITITPTIHNVITPADICDSYTWSTGNGETYTADTVALWSRANATDAQCTDVDTLKLVVKHSNTGIDTLVACDTYTWIDGNTYTASNTTATHTLTNAAGCDSVVTLNLTINNSFVGAGTDIDTLGASITLTDKNGSYLFLAPYDNDTTLVYQTVAGCDSTVTFHLTVNQFQIVAENPIECGIYTWNNAGHGTGHTYKWISDAEKSANAINIPGTSPMMPLYKDITTDIYVYSRPMDTVGDIVYMLNLNLNEAQFVDSTIARFPQSVDILTLHGTDFDFTGLTSATKPAADTVVYLTLPHATLCGTVMTYNVHVVYNYDTNAVTVCYTDTYTWEDSTTSAVTVGSGNTITKTLFAGDWTNEQVVTRTITVRANNNTYSFDQEACDSYTWNDSTYTTTGAYQQTFTDQYGCDSVATLNLTVKNNNNHGEILAACDSTQWNGEWYSVSGDYTYNYTHTNGCASVDTLHLTINHNVPQVTTESACDNYTWVVGEWSREYTVSGVYTHTRNDANSCPAVDTLQLTIRESTVYDSVMWVTDGSYRYTAQDNTVTMIMANNSASFTEHYTNAAGCDSTLNITINVGPGYFQAEDAVSCNSYTWRDGNTYVWISDEERAANGNALYKNQGTGAYVMSNPVYRVPQVGDYDSIYMLRLNLTQNYTEDFTIDFPISLGTLTYGDSTFNFAVTNDEGREFVNTTVEKEVHFASSYYCDSIHYLTINLQNNYSEVTAENADICVTQTSYTWRNHILNTETNDFDHAHTYYMYDTVGTAEAPVIEYIKVTQHPVVYATERRTACDSYTWNGMVFTSSTSNATFDTVDMWGCDSTVTLMLTINHNSSLVTTTAECESYQWKANNAAQTVIGTYTQSGEYAYEYISDEGCPSTDSLYLTINTNSNTAYTVDECDSYTWNNMTLTASCDTVYAYTNLAGCPSVDTLHLTIRNNSNQGYTQKACDSYVWHDSTYTASTTAYFQYEAENGCASVDTLYLTINTNAGFADTLTACDSIDWNGHKYYESGEYTVHYADANGCEADSVLTLTVNSATHNSETVVACDSYTWHGTVYTTSGVQTYSYDNTDNCASVDTLHLTINHSDYDGVNYATQTVNDWCGDYTWTVNDSVVGVYTESVETSTRFTSPVTGCDSIIFLNLTIKNAPVIDTAATVCENTLPYEWRGIEMSEAGVETVTFPLENGCDSTIRFTLTVNPKYETALTADVCLGSGYNENGFDITAEQLPEVGEYTFTKELTSEYGCDSIVTLTVNVKNFFTTTVEATACDSYTWDLNNMTYTTSGNYTDTLPAINSCDSIVTLALTINTSTTGVDVQTACNRYTWIDGNTYTANNNTATFTLDNANADGCDSIVTLNLTVNYSNSYEFDDVACDSYTWNGATYSQSGNYTYAGTNVDGCDSVVTLHLTINNGTTATVEATACNSYEWTDGNGQTYTESGNYTYTTAAVNGCDSVVTLALTINTPANTTEEVTACESYVWNNETYTTSGQYTYDFVDGNGCDAVATLNLTINTPASTIETVTACDSYSWNNQTYTNSGEYTNAFVDANGCTAKATLILTINASSSSNDVVTTCGSYDWNGQTYSQTGLYTYTTTNAAGCDSTATLSLVINQSVSSTETATACDSYEWNNTVYTESGVYTFNSTTGEGCDSVATLLLTIKNSTNNAETVTVCDSYTWNNTEYTTSGDYTYSYTNAAGCASVDTLHLTINASTEETVNATACDTYTWTTGNGQTYTTSGNYTYQTTNLAGCEHLVTLALTINNATSSTTTEEACNSYTWNGQTYNQTGIYTYQTTNAHGCDSVATLALTIKPSYASTESQTACGSYTWNGQTYTTTGNYTYSTTATNGCDSVMTLSLTINNPVNNTINQTACDSYTWTGATGATYTTSGDYTYTTTSALTGCDSVTTLHLTINPATSESVYAESCSSYIWNGQTYNQSGVYTYQTTNVHGCDSTVTLQLNIMQPALTTIDRIVCDSYTWNGQTYTASGNYTYNTTTLEGCDSTVVLVLTVNNSYNVNIAETACSSYSWNGQTYTTSGNYSQVFAAANGCDSTVTLALTINTPVTETVVESACSSYEWNGETYTTSGVYTYTTTGANGCDSVTTLYLTINLPVYVNIDVNAEGNYNWNGETYTESGVYTYTTVAANGCDSVTTLNLTVTPVYTVTLVSINDEWGTVSESGTIAENGYFTATATANEGYVFLAWVNSDIDTVSTNATYVFQVTEDITLYAVFVPKQVGIEDVDMDNVTIYSTDSRIIVRGAEGHDVYVYDVNGRMMDRQLNAPENLEFRMTATGVYLVKVGNAPAKRVVVVR